MLFGVLDCSRNHDVLGRGHQTNRTGGTADGGVLDGAGGLDSDSSGACIYWVLPLPYVSVCMVLRVLYSAVNARH